MGLAMLDEPGTEFLLIEGGHVVLEFALPLHLRHQLRLCNLQVQLYASTRVTRGPWGTYLLS